MSLPIILRPEAEQDLISAFDWYEGQQEGLGNQFIAEMDACFDRIAERPAIYAVAYADIRACRARRFPYLVYFRVLQTQVEVLAVLHGNRDPSTWQSRV